MLERHLHLNSSGHFRQMPDHHTQRDQPMDYLLIWVLGGRGFGQTGPHRHEVSTGDLLSFPPGPPHEYGADPQQPWDIVWVHYQGSLAAEFTAAIRRHAAGPGSLVRLGLDDELRDRWLELVAIHWPRDPRWAARTNTALCALLGLLIHRLEQKQLAAGHTESLHLHRLQQYISQHLAEPISLADLAREASLSPTHFARVFKRQLGISPINYVIQKRMAQACALLTETRQPLKQIAAAVGYEDPFYFSRLFKQTIGQSPSGYRAAATAATPNQRAATTALR